MSYINKLIYLFILSTFLPVFYAPYLVLGLGILYLFTILLIGKKITITNGKILFFGLVLFLWASISWVYNNFVGNSDFLALFLWASTYLFPFFIMLFVSLKHNMLEFDRAFEFYKKILLLQFVLGIFQAISMKDFAGDHIKGTCIDSHILGIHYAIATIIIFTRLMYLSNRKDLLYFAVYLIGMVMTGYTSNVVFLFGILILISLVKTKMFTKLSKASLLLIFLAPIIGIGFSKVKHHGLEYVKYGISEILRNWTNLEESKLLGKIYSYKVSFIDIPREINIFFGYGPGTYTSRASQIRIPEYSATKLPIKIGTFKTELFEKYITPWYVKGEDAPIRGASWGTMASPMTSVVSTWVELGIIGFLIFIFLFYHLFLQLNKKIKMLKICTSYNFVYSKSCLYLLLFFIIELLYLNYWEYPQITIPVFTFCILLLKNETNNYSTYRSKT